MPVQLPLIKVLLLGILLTLQTAFAQKGKGIYDCKTEYLHNPIGIDNNKPRLTWKLASDVAGVQQKAYRIVVDADSMAVVKGNGTMWNTGWVTSVQQLVPYAGKQLQPYTKYYWRVDVTDNNNRKIALAQPALFEMGKMSSNNWVGAWIADNDNRALKGAPYFRKTFSTAKKVVAARAYIAAAGLYELYLNGEKVGDHRLDPMYTRYDRRTLYVAYDVTQHLQFGQNAVGVLLGNGWYNHQPLAVWDFHHAPWRARPTFCMDMRITYNDGSVETIATDKSWKTSLGPLTYNAIYTADHIDARLQQPGWNKAGFADTAWKEVVYRSAPSKNIVAQQLHPIRLTDAITPKQVQKLNDTTYVFDFGRNISGITKLTVNGEEGTVIKLKHGERKYANGHVDISNIDIFHRPTDKTDPFQTDIYTLGGKGAEVFMPLFNYKGFQYVEVTSSKPIKLSGENLTAYFMHSDVPFAGNISSSDTLINKIWWATNNSYLSNLFGYPTDCPQREKNGWTGDAAIAIETGLYNFDAYTIYEKWLADHRDEQQPNGVLPAIIPTGGWGYHWANGPDWTSTIAIIPWTMYLFYGDDKPLRDCYDNIKRYVNHITDIAPDGVTNWGLGDWVPVKTVTPLELTSTCYYYNDVVILSKAALLFGNTADHKKYVALAAKIKDAFNARFLNMETGIYDKGSQTALSAPLYWGLVPQNIKGKVAANLAQKVAQDNYHLDVGILGHKAILNALSDNGYADVAYKIATQKTYPSWGWWIVNGATTLYENWKIDAASDISMNHIMFGEIGAWLYKGLGGIKPDTLQPGFKKVLLQPNFVDGLDTFAATHTGPYGNITSSWVRNRNAVTYTVEVPANTTALLTMPAVAGKAAYAKGQRVLKKFVTLAAGRHQFEWR